MEETLECTETALELLVLNTINQSLKVLTTIFIAMFLEDSWILENILKLKKKDIFVKILLGTTIWDSSKKEKSNNCI